MSIPALSRTAPKAQTVGHLRVYQNASNEPGLSLSVVMLHRNAMNARLGSLVRIWNREETSSVEGSKTPTVLSPSLM